MATTEQLADRNRAAILPEKARKEIAYRFNKLIAWLNAQSYSWLQLNLAEYQQYLREEGFSDWTIASHISAIRSRYREILSDREAFAELAKGQLQEGQSADDAMASLRQTIESAPTAGLVDQRLSTEFRVLDAEQYFEFWNEVRLKATDNLMGLRDVALVELMFNTGVSESEVIRLKVDDLHHKIGELSALRVEQVRGSKFRLAPYLRGQVPPAVESWIEAAGLGQGDWLFRTFYQGGNAMRQGHMRLAAVRQILERYPFEFEQGETAAITSTDIRANYACRMHLQGESIEAIAQYLGASVEMVERFVSAVQNGSE